MKLSRHWTNYTNSRDTVTAKGKNDQEREYILIIIQKLRYLKEEWWSNTTLLIITFLKADHFILLR